MPRNPGLSQITNLIKYISLIFGAILQYVGYNHVKSYFLPKILK